MNAKNGYGMGLDMQQTKTSNLEYKEVLEVAESTFSNSKSDSKHNPANTDFLAYDEAMKVVVDNWLKVS
jgi:hypothetical protein